MALTVHILEPVLFFLGAALLGAGVRWWRPEVSRRALLAYLVLVTAFFAGPLFTGGLQVPTDYAYRWLPWRDMVERRPVVANPLLSDVIFEQIPFHTLVRERLLALEAPLWANEIGTGQPLLGNAQSSALAPLHLMALPLPTKQALSVTAAWQVLLSLLLMHAFLLRLGAGELGAGFGAVAYGLSTFLIPWAYHPHAMVAAWFPGLLLGLLLLRHGERGGFTGLVVCGLGMASGGHPATMSHAALAAAGALAALLLDRAPGRWRFVARLGAAGVLTACLSAPVLLPVLEAIPQSERSEQVKQFPRMVQPPRFESRLFLPVIDPLVFGSARDYNWNGPRNFNETCSTWAGLVTLAMAVAGAVVFRGRIAAILLGGLLALLASLKIQPLFDLVEALPGIGGTSTARLRLLWVLAVVVAGALSVGRMTEDRRTRIAGAAALVAAGIALVVFPPPGGSVWQQAWWLTALGAAAVTLTVLLVPRLHPWFPRVALVGLAAELFLLGVRFHPLIRQPYDLAPPPALAYLMEQARKSPEPFRVYADRFDLHPNLAAAFGLWEPRHDDPMHPWSSSRFVRRRLLAGPEDLQFAAESYLAVRYRLMAHRRRLPPPWRPVFNAPGGRIWENPEALPLFLMPRRFMTLADEREVTTRTLSWRGIRDFRDLAVAPGGAGKAQPQKGTVRSIRAGANRFEIQVDSPAGGVVVSSVSYAPGWQVETGEQTSPAFEVNSAFLGFRVPPGSHGVRLVYRPAGWRIGWVLFGLGVGGMVIAWMVRRARSLAA